MKIPIEFSKNKFKWIMNQEEKKFWQDYKKRTLEGIENLLNDKMNNSAGKLFFIVIENFGSFRLGMGVKGSKKKVLPPGCGRSSSQEIKDGFQKLGRNADKEAFFCFLKEYIKDFNQDIFIQRDKLWENYRCGLIHDGMVRNKHKITLSGSLVKKDKSGKIELNIKKFYKLIMQKSLPKFDNELNVKKHVVNRWRERYNFLNK